MASYTVALQKDPDNIGYKIALENARIQASRIHYDEARKALAADELDQAADELDIATKYDSGNNRLRTTWPSCKTRSGSARTRRSGSPISRA